MKFLLELILFVEIEHLNAFYKYEQFMFDEVFDGDPLNNPVTVLHQKFGLASVWFLLLDVTVRSAFLTLLAYWLVYQFK